jgi:hypothetical protein
MQNWVPSTCIRCGIIAEIYEGETRVFGWTDKDGRFCGFQAAWLILKPVTLCLERYGLFQDRSSAAPSEKTRVDSGSVALEPGVFLDQGAGVRLEAAHRL